MEPIKKCPFCGSEAKVTKKSKGFRVECKERWKKCLINMRTHHFSTEEGAILSWNFRRPVR